jgi:hypothetical protein
LNLTATNIKIQKTHHIPSYLCRIRAIVSILILLKVFPVFAQEKHKGLNSGYDRREEILYEGKRYRINNNYLTLGGGMLVSNIRDNDQKVLGADFTFHIKRAHFQTGLMMSGQQFLSNNNVQGHLCYGFRKETERFNLAAFGGISLFTGVRGVKDSAGAVVPMYYEGAGLYFSAQAITKFAYDMGAGLEMFGDLGHYQSTVGVKLILFFSGAYRGLKQKYNPYVRAENP